MGQRESVKRKGRIKGWKYKKGRANSPCLFSFGAPDLLRAEDAVARVAETREYVSVLVQLTV